MKEVDDQRFLKHCLNYNKIINYEFAEGDYISDKLVSIYKSYVFNCNYDNKDDVKRIEKLDNVLNNYLNDYLFRNMMQQQIINIKVKRDNNILRNLVDKIINIFFRYAEYTTRKIYLSKWI